MDRSCTLIKLQSIITETYFTSSGNTTRIEHKTLALWEKRHDRSQTILQLIIAEIGSPRKW